MDEAGDGLTKQGGRAVRGDSLSKEAGVGILIRRLFFNNYLNGYGTGDISEKNLPKHSLDKHWPFLYWNLGIMFFLTRNIKCYNDIITS
jgi:hypothetical protein